MIHWTKPFKKRRISDDRGCSSYSFNEKCDSTYQFSSNLAILRTHLTLHTNTRRNMHQYIIALISPLKAFCVTVAKSRYCSHRFNNLEAKTCGKTCSGENLTRAWNIPKYIRGKLKGIVHPKNENSVIICTPSCCSKHSWLAFGEHKRKNSD